MNGHLSVLGVHVPRAKLRASIHRVDPINTALRRSIVVRRRVYHVSGPNAVWHIDGNHKLIRWTEDMVIHGGVDGYSRTIVYLKCAQNNQADTVMVAAVDEYGLPECVRSDLGGENVEVWRFMIEQHSSESSVITGSSTHNERIERLWRDVTRSVGSYVYATFQELELNGHLDVLNEVDMFCLHYTYIPRLNHFLKVFTECWNNHSLSSEHNQRSPLLPLWRLWPLKTAMSGKRQKVDGVGQQCQPVKVAPKSKEPTLWHTGEISLITTSTKAYIQ